MSEQNSRGIRMSVVCAGGYYEIRHDNGETLANFADLVDAQVCMLAIAQARLAAIDECQTLLGSEIEDGANIMHSHLDGVAPLTEFAYRTICGKNAGLLFAVNALEAIKEKSE